MSITTTPSSWPAVIIGLILGSYWLRVLQMVAQTRATVGRAANFVPPSDWAATTVGMDSSGFALDFPAADDAVPGWIAAGAFAATFHWQRRRRVDRRGCRDRRVRHYLGLLDQDGTSWRMGIDPNEHTTLVSMAPMPTCAIQFTDSHQC